MMIICTLLWIIKEMTLIRNVALEAEIDPSEAKNSSRRLGMNRREAIYLLIKKQFSPVVFFQVHMYG
jgi:hypothetical protein